jgi:hypothetical protein
VAEGYVLVDGERFKYREVDAPIEWETEALLAANAHGGEWDTDILKVNFADFPSIDLDLAGFAVKDLQALDIQIEPIRIHTPSFFQEQAEEETDEDYLKNNPGPDGFEAKERIPNNTVYEKKEPEAIPPVKDINPFEEVKENTEVAGRRIVLIIDCPTDEKKKELKEKLRPFVDESGCQFF